MENKAKNKELKTQAPSHAMFHVPCSMFHERGFTLMEMLIYVAIAGIVVTVITSFLMDNLKAYDKSVAQQNVFQNVTNTLRIITDEIKYAKGLYTPTSVLDDDAGQLSVETTINAPAGEESVYVDFYLDNGRVYEKRDGQNASPLTSERVFVEILRFEKLSAGVGQDSITISVQARINTPSTDVSKQARVALNSSVTLRGAY